MKSTDFSLKGLEKEECSDLGAAIIALTGVADVEIDTDAQRVHVTYDPALAHRETIKQAIVAGGYPVE